MSIAGLTETDVAVYGTVAVFLPGVNAIINRPHFPAWAKQIIMFVTAVIAAAVAYGLKNGFDFSNRAAIIAALAGVWVATQAAYLLFWQHGIAPTLEAGVNGGSKTAQAPDAGATLTESNPEPDGYDTPTVGRDLGPADGQAPRGK